MEAAYRSAGRPADPPPDVRVADHPRRRGVHARQPRHGATPSDYLRYWPAGLIAIGLAKLWQVRGGQGSAIGGVLFIARRHLDAARHARLSSTSASSDFWPLLLVFVGGMIVWQGLRGAPAARDGGRANDTVNAVAILSGVNRGSNSPAFQGRRADRVHGRLRDRPAPGGDQRRGGHRCVRDVGRHRDPRAGELDGDRPRDAADGRLRGQDAAAAGRQRAPPDHPRRGDHGRRRGEELDHAPDPRARASGSRCTSRSGCSSARCWRPARAARAGSAGARRSRSAFPLSLAYALRLPVGVVRRRGARRSPPRGRLRLIADRRSARRSSAARAWLLLARGWIGAARPLGRRRTRPFDEHRADRLRLRRAALPAVARGRATSLGGVRACARRPSGARCRRRCSRAKPSCGSLRAQIDPHFLFNSLHSISALTTASIRPAARRMCLLLGDFLRESLALGAAERIPLARELALAREVPRGRAGAVRRPAAGRRSMPAAPTTASCRRCCCSRSSRTR